MLVAALVPLIATALGTALGLGARRWHVVVEPVRSFALAAVTVTIAVHLMPEAVEEAGPWAIAVLAGGLMLPSALGWVGARLGAAGDGHATVAVELTFLGVLAHQIGDGVALGALGSSWDVVLAIGAHTVPLAAVVAITFAEREGRTRAIVRAIPIALFPLVGLAIGRAGASSHAIAPWLNAAVSGLLLHVLAHDLPSARDRSYGVRTIELVAIAAGVALPLLVRDEHHAHGLVSTVPAALRDLALIAAPPLLAGVLVGAVIHVAARRARVRWLSGGGGPGAAFRGAILGVPLPPCSCDIVPVARDLRAQGGGAAFVSAFVLAAPELDVAAVLLTWTFFGWQLALVRLLAAVTIAIIAAVVIEQIARARSSTRSDAWIPPGPQSFVDGIDDQIAHDGSWIVVGLVVAAFVVAAASLGTFSGGVTAALIILAALPLALSSTAATPIAAALVAAGLDPGAMLAAVLLATMVKPSTLAFVRAAWGTTAAVAAMLAAAFAAIACTFAVRAAAPTLDGLELPRAVQLASIVGLGALAAASLWRHGLAHWLAALRGSDHGHEHAHGAEHHDHHHGHDH